MQIESPYRSEPSQWLRGQLHSHSTESDGTRAPQEVVSDYASRGYDFLMLSDHDRLTPTEGLDAQGMVLIPGNEISARGPHLLHVNAEGTVPPNEDRQKVLDDIRGDGHGFAVMNHPNWLEHFNHCPQELLEAWQGYAGIEIYNGVIRRLPGSPLATDRWDRLLGSGRRVWGFANDDSHADIDVELAWNMVQYPVHETPTVDGIVVALRTGRFYASTGVVIRSITVDGPAITVQTENAQHILAVVDFGRIIAEADGPILHYRVPSSPNCRYVRIECYGAGEAMAWTQPFFITP